ncbi:TetR/AcrR family transcriptional regulator [Shewanella sp. OPT22]|nr:TetR/AcrR family transcriptional regulator [Shewanella sp. OPT22]
MKRELLIDTATELFYCKGVNEVGINEILKKSGVAKRTLYHHFTSKEDLVIATLEKRDKAFCKWLDDRLSMVDEENEVLGSLFSAIEDWLENRARPLNDFYGCYFINTSVELSRQSEKVKQYCMNHKLRVKDIISDHLASTSQQLINAIYLLIEGAIVIAFMTGSTEELKSSKLVTQKLLQD